MKYTAGNNVMSYSGSTKKKAGLQKSSLLIPHLPTYFKVFGSGAISPAAAAMAFGLLSDDSCCFVASAFDPSFTAGEWQDEEY